jgi:outer membrane murein-binding lipoprotein Lpp
MADPRIDRLESDVRVLISLVAPLETKVQAQKTEIEALAKEVANLREKWSNMKGDERHAS